MSRRNRRPPSQRRERQPDPPGPDVATLARLARFGGFADFEGEQLPVVEPHGPIADQMDFDRRVCDAGLKAFIRPRAGDDWPEGLGEDPPAGFSHVVVREMTPGVRVRELIGYCPLHELN